MELYKMLSNYTRLTTLEQQKIDECVDKAILLRDKMTVRTARELDKHVEELVSQRLGFSFSRDAIMFLAGYLLAKKENK